MLSIHGYNTGIQVLVLNTVPIPSGSEVLKCTQLILWLRNTEHTCMLKKKVSKQFSTIFYQRYSTSKNIKEKLEEQRKAPY